MKAAIKLVIPPMAFAVIALVFAVGFLSSQRWFGVEDLRVFAIWTAILSVGVAAGAHGYAHFSLRWNFHLAIALSFLAGGLLGFLMTLLVLLTLGAWFGAFSFPVFYCWLGGAIVACVIATAIAEREEQA